MCQSQLPHGASRAIFILCECCRRRSVPLHGFEAILSQTVDIMLHLKYSHDVGQYRGHIDLLAVHPEDIGRNVAMFDFSQTKALIEADYQAARRELARICWRRGRPWPGRAAAYQKSAI